jgi:hypothetical protein
MQPHIYKTSPRLLILSTLLFGSIFSFEWLLLIWKQSFPFQSIEPIIILIIFTLLLIVSLYYFLKLRKLVLTNNFIEVKYIFLPFSRKISLCEIKNISQKSRDVRDVNFFSNRYFFTEYITILELKMVNK